MGTKYTYSIFNDTLNGVVNPITLRGEIGDSNITVALDYINTSDDDLDIWFKLTLSSGESTILSGVVANHSGIFTESTQPVSSDGRPVVRADSRPIGTKTYFSTAGDGIGIGDGKDLVWDFSTSNDEVTAPSGYKTKRIKVSFCDPVYIKEGSVYFFSAQKNSYVDFYVVCPSGQYYNDRQGISIQATEDTKVIHYINKHRFAGDCPMGDELNTEGCSENSLPNNYELWIEVTVPSGDNSSYGWGNIELYRERTILFPGESQ